MINCKTLLIDDNAERDGWVGNQSGYSIPVVCIGRHIISLEYCEDLLDRAWDDEHELANGSQSRTRPSGQSTLQHRERRLNYG